MKKVDYDDRYLLAGISKKWHYTDVSINRTFSQWIELFIIRLVMALANLVISVLHAFPLLWNIFEMIARVSPRNAVGYYLRGCYYKNSLGYMGKNVIIDMGVYISSPERVSIDDDAWIDTYTSIRGASKGSISIGKGVHIASYVVLDGNDIQVEDYAAISAGSCIYSQSNYYDGKSMSAASPPQMQSIKYAPVVIGKYAFIGLNSVVLPGITIGDSAVIGAGSVVTKSIPPQTIAMGVPAKVVRKRE